MVAIPSRRAALTAGASTLLNLSGDHHHPLGYSNNIIDIVSSSSPAQQLCSNLICNYTPLAFRTAVAATEKFLYRGEGDDIAQPTILAPPPDLLLPGTYVDPAALYYFQCLEQRLIEDNTNTNDTYNGRPRRINRNNNCARPSLGHIATSDRKEASQWGQAVTIWPMGESLSFVYPLKRKVFFPYASTTTTTATTKECRSEDELAMNHDLAFALEQGHEVMFASEFTARGQTLPKMIPGGRSVKSAFLVVPAEFEDSLLELIKTEEFIAIKRLN